MEQALIPHLFRTEFSRITAVLCRAFGIAHIETAEDIAGETFLAALETWPYKGIPPNPSAWLYTVAKNKARNRMQREQLFAGKIAPLLKQEPGAEEIDIDLSDKNFTDSQLQMLFAVCHPSISTEAQIGLALRILCGFGIDEIANALLTNKETVNKRLLRAKEKLRIENVKIEFPGNGEINKRLDAVLTTLYLLFNEGYYSESRDTVLREDLCQEAMRLNFMLIENEQSNLPRVNALYALMCFQSSRFKARKNESAEIILYREHDESLWDRERVARGSYFLHQSARGETLSPYHLEAAIAYWHTIKEDTAEKWENILQLFDQLLQLKYNPVAALNRSFAFSKVYGKEKAIVETEKLDLKNNHYYFTLLGELYTGLDDGRAARYFKKAITMAKSQTDRDLLQKKLDILLS